MSYINDALRKAQSEKDSRYGNYRDIVFTAVPRRSSAGRKGLLFVCSSVAILLMVTGIYYAHQSTGSASFISQPLSTKAKAESAKQVPVALPVQNANDDRNTTSNTGKSVQELYRTALDAQKKGLLVEAERIYRAILERQPAHSRALNNLGIIYMDQNRTADAVRMFNQAVSANDGSVDPYYNLACIYARTNDVILGLHYLKTAVVMNPAAKGWAREDNDFRNLRSSPEFKKITE